MNKSKILLIVSCMMLLAITSCKKLNDEIVGTWNVMTFDNSPEGTMQLTFDSDSTAVRIYNSPSGIYVDSCNYQVIKKLAKQKLVFTNSKMLPGADVLNGTYRLDRMKNDVIVLTRTMLENEQEGGAYYRLELKRKN